eukprot:scaffold20733_cov45-Phaeocystis_antarctica.AAC.1
MHKVAAAPDCLSASPRSQAEEVRVYSDDDRGRAVLAAPALADLYSDAAAARRRHGIVLELL